MSKAAVVGKVLSGKKLTTAVERAGQISDIIAKHNKPLLEELSDIEADLKVSVFVGNPVESDHYVAKITETSRRVIDMEAAKRQLGQKLFLEIATVTIGNLEDHLGKAQMDVLTTNYKVSQSLSVKPKK